jgi:hypothetical protein
MQSGGLAVAKGSECGERFPRIKPLAVIGLDETG